MNTNTYIISWDMTGLEAVVDVTETLRMANDFERESIFMRIRDPHNEPKNKSLNDINQVAHMMMLRARANSQRHYEIYILKTTEDITKADLERMFEDNPQAIADLIRERGDQLYSDRVNKRTQVIE